MGGRFPCCVREQEGAQKIIGFNFKASLTMDMEEVFEGEDEKLGQRKIKFKLVRHTHCLFRSEPLPVVYRRRPVSCCSSWSSIHG